MCMTLSQEDVHGSHQSAGVSTSLHPCHAMRQRNRLHDWQYISCIIRLTVVYTVNHISLYSLCCTIRGSICRPPKSQTSS
jgi:hypothetical protein